MQTDNENMLQEIVPPLRLDAQSLFFSCFISHLPFVLISHCCPL